MIIYSILNLFYVFIKYRVRLIYEYINIKGVLIMTNHIGSKLKKLRKAKNLTTQQVADRVNVSQSYISRFENGRAVPDIDMLEKILHSLDTDLATFFSKDMNDTPEDMIELIETIKTLTPEARIKLNEFLKVIQKTNRNDN